MAAGIPSRVPARVVVSPRGKTEPRLAWADLPQGQLRGADLLLTSADTDLDVWVELPDGEAARTRFDNRFEQRRSVVVVTSTGAGFDYLASAEWSVIHLEPDQLPFWWTGLPTDRILLHAPAELGLEPQQVRALMAWVTMGGSLCIVTGLNPAELDPFKEWSPFEANGVESDGGVPFMSGKVVAGTVAVRWKDRPFTVVRRLGKGRLGYVTLESTSPVGPLTYGIEEGADEPEEVEEALETGVDHLFPSIETTVVGADGFSHSDHVGHEANLTEVKSAYWSLAPLFVLSYLVGGLRLYGLTWRARRRILLPLVAPAMALLFAALPLALSTLGQNTGSESSLLLLDSGQRQGQVCGHVLVHGPGRERLDLRFPADTLPHWQQELPLGTSRGPEGESTVLEGIAAGRSPANTVLVRALTLGDGISFTVAYRQERFEVEAVNGSDRTLRDCRVCLPPVSFPARGAKSAAPLQGTVLSEPFVLPPGKHRFSLAPDPNWYQGAPQLSRDFMEGSARSWMRLVHMRAAEKEIPLAEVDRDRLDRQELLLGWTDRPLLDPRNREFDWRSRGLVVVVREVRP